MTAEKSKFETLAAIDVSKQCEKKNGFTYLSWAWAVDTLLRHDPMANWKYGEPMRFNETVMVFCTVTAFGKPMTMQLPVIDFRNKPISNPSAMDVNTAMMRCLVKAIALHGLGLYIYAGEDVPQDDVVKGAIHKPTAGLYQPDAEELIYLTSIVDAVIANKDDYTTSAEHLESLKLDSDEKVWVWDKLDSKTRSGIKKYNAIKKDAIEIVVHPNVD